MKSWLHFAIVAAAVGPWTLPSVRCRAQVTTSGNAAESGAQASGQQPQTAGASSWVAGRSSFRTVGNRSAWSSIDVGFGKSGSAAWYAGRSGFASEPQPGGIWRVNAGSPGIATAGSSRNPAGISPHLSIASAAGVTTAAFARTPSYGANHISGISSLAYANLASRGLRRSHGRTAFTRAHGLAGHGINVHAAARLRSGGSILPSRPAPGLSGIDTGLAPALPNPGLTPGSGIGAAKAALGSSLNAGLDSPAQ